MCLKQGRTVLQWQSTPSVRSLKRTWPRFLDKSVLFRVFQSLKTDKRLWRFKVQLFPIISSPSKIKTIERRPTMQSPVKASVTKTSRLCSNTFKRSNGEVGLWPCTALNQCTTHSTNRLALCLRKSTQLKVALILNSALKLLMWWRRKGKKHLWRKW